MADGLFQCIPWINHVLHLYTWIIATVSTLLFECQLCLILEPCLHTKNENQEISRKIPAILNSLFLWQLSFRLFTTTESLKMFKTYPYMFLLSIFKRYVLVITEWVITPKVYWHSNLFKSYKAKLTLTLSSNIRFLQMYATVFFSFNGSILNVPLINVPIFNERFWLRDRLQISLLVIQRI